MEAKSESQRELLILKQSSSEIVEDEGEEDGMFDPMHKYACMH